MLFITGDDDKWCHLIFALLMLSCFNSVALSINDKNDEKIMSWVQIHGRSKVLNKHSKCFLFFIPLRELVKTNLHARDPLLRGGGKEETMGLRG